MDFSISDIYKKAKGYITPHSKVVKTNCSIKDNDPFILQYLIEVPEDFVINDSGLITFVCVYSTYISIKCLPTTKLIDKEIYIKPFLDTLRLMRYNKRTKRNELIWRCYLYHRNLFEYRVPRYALKDLEKCLQSQGCRYKVIYENFNDSEIVDIGINSNWIPRDYQYPIIEFLSNKQVGTIRGTKLSMGYGKSFISIYTLNILKKPSMIICAGLVEQWLKNIKDITTVDEKDIFVIQGSDSIHKLFKDEKYYKIYIASLGTLRSWITNEDSIYTDVPSYEEFLNKFKIGAKIIDEFHLNFAAIISIDLRSNIESNIYLSATPLRADKNANKIFNTVFPYNNIIGINNIDRYVNTTQYSYSLHIPNSKRVVTQYGYSHTRYEAILLSRENILQEYIMRIIKPLVDSHYVNKFSNGKLLIFVSTVAMIMSIYKYFSYYYDSLVVNTYIAQDSKENLDISDIIISTPKSCGVGVDIKNLVCTINTVTVSSEALVKQMFGRLRKLPDGRTPEYVDIYNELIPSQIHHGRTRFKIYRSLSKRLEIFKI